MSQWNRVLYAFAASVVAVGLGTFVEILLTGASSSVRIGDFIFSPLFFLPVFVLFYLVAPRLARRQRFD